jgi:hypothetical protein
LIYQTQGVPQKIEDFWGLKKCYAFLNPKIFVNKNFGGSQKPQVFGTPKK